MGNASWKNLVLGVLVSVIFSTEDLFGSGSSAYELTAEDRQNMDKAIEDELDGFTLKLISDLRNKSEVVNRDKDIGGIFLLCYSDYTNADERINAINLYGSKQKCNARFCSDFKVELDNKALCSGDTEFFTNKFFVDLETTGCMKVSSEVMKSKYKDTCLCVFFDFPQLKLIPYLLYESTLNQGIYNYVRLPKENFIEDIKERTKFFSETIFKQPSVDLKKDVTARINKLFRMDEAISSCNAGAMKVVKAPPVVDDGPLIDIQTEGQNAPRK